MHLHANTHNVRPHTHAHTPSVCGGEWKGGEESVLCIVHCKYAYSMHALVLAARAVNRRAGRGRGKGECKGSRVKRVPVRRGGGESLQCRTTVGSVAHSSRIGKIFLRLARKAACQIFLQHFKHIALSPTSALSVTCPLPSLRHLPLGKHPLCHYTHTHIWGK